MEPAISYVEMDEFTVGPPIVNELTQEIDKVIEQFDLTMADLLVAYDRDALSDGITDPVCAGAQLTLCLNLIQQFGTAAATLDGVYNRALSIAMSLSEQKTVDARTLDAKTMCVKIVMRKKYLEAALETLAWRTPVLRDVVKGNMQYG